MSIQKEDWRESVLHRLAETGNCFKVHFPSALDKISKPDFSPKIAFKKYHASESSE